MRKTDKEIIDRVNAMLDQKWLPDPNTEDIEALISIIHDQSKEIERLKDGEFIESQDTHLYDRLMEKHIQDYHTMTAKEVTENIYDHMNSSEQGLDCSSIMKEESTVSSTAYKDQVRIINPK